MKKIIKRILKTIKKNIKKVSYKDIIIFLIPFVMCGIYWIVFYPGILSYDSYNQLQQIESMNFTPAHPFFHTFIEMILMKVWNTPAVIGLFQITVFSILWCSICKYNRGKKDTKVMFWSQIFVTILIVLNPLNKALSITLWKDVLYSYSILWLCFELQKLVDRKFKINTLTLLKISFILILIPNFRHNGLIITVLMSIILLILFIIKDRKSKNYIKFIPFLIIFFFSFKGLEKIYSVNYENSMSASSSTTIIDYKLLNLTGEIARDEKLSQKDIEELSKYVNYAELKSKTYYHTLDYIWLACDPNVEEIKNNKLSFYKMIGRLSFENPIPSLRFITKETSFVWKIIRLSDSWGYINYTGIRANTYVRPFENTFVYEALSKYVPFTTDNVLFQTVFYSGSLCLYLSIAFIIYLKKKHKTNMLLVFLPIVFNVVGLILTMPVNDVRYYYSNFLVLYLMSIIFCKYWVSENEV